MVARNAWQKMAVADLDLALTLKSGQFFRYYEETGHFLLLTKGLAIRLRQDSELLWFSGASKDVVCELLQINVQYARSIARLQRDPVLGSIMRAYPGLHVMRQDLHECILGFICSSQSNIPKIRMNLHLLSQHCGQRVGEHRFLPVPGQELDHALVLSAKTGYRAKFLVSTNRLLTPARLNAIRRADYAGSHRLLCELPGIGPKIADCVCLFALGHGEAFPVDVHIMRAMRALFPKAALRNEAAIKSFAQQRWGKDAGLAQQFIYQWARDHLRSTEVPA